jgi:hypothetical protein
MSIRAPGPGILAAIVAAAALAGCAAPRHEECWSRLRCGMTRPEVEQLLGRPSSTFVPPAAPDGTVPPDRGPRGERWQYGDTLSSMATRAMFPDEADERAWCVFFGADGTVSGFRPPSWATGFAASDPVTSRSSAR